MNSYNIPNTASENLQTLFNSKRSHRKLAFLSLFIDEKTAAQRRMIDLQRTVKLKSEPDLISSLSDIKKDHHFPAVTIWGIAKIGDKGQGNILFMN